MIEINGAWYLKTSPFHIIAEAPDGSAFVFRNAPFRTIDPEECESYPAPLTEACGDPIPTFMWETFGLKLPAEA